MIFQAAGIGAHPVVCAAKQAIERQPKLLGLQIPNRLVDRLPKQAGTNIPAARARQTVRQHKRALAYQPRPHLGGEYPLKYSTGRERMEQRREEPQPSLATAAQFQCTNIVRIAPNLRVADHALARKLVARDLEVFNG